MIEHEYKYMVATRCFTYEHAPYIEDTLRGFIMQETTFPVVFLIVDDGSSDGEQDILYNWANTNLVAEEVKSLWRKMSYGYLAEGKLIGNPNSSFVILLLTDNHYRMKKPKLPYLADWLRVSKYHALCEGDDYWIYPLKLQWQFDFMEHHPDYSMCFTNALVNYDNIDLSARLFNQLSKDCEMKLADLLDKWICPTASILYRPSAMPLFPLKDRVISGDWYLVLNCVVKGRVWGMKAVTACYRKTKSSVSMSNIYAQRSDEIFFKKVPILEGLDKFTGKKYHQLIKKYIAFYRDFGEVVHYKKEHGLLMTCMVKPITLTKVVWRKYILPKLNHKAPTFSA